MNLYKFLEKIRPTFDKGGRLSKLHSLYEGMESFLYVPDQTAKCGTHIHDCIDSKRIMSFVVIALLPALLFGMYNVGYQNYLAAGTLASASVCEMFAYGALKVIPMILVSYIVGLGIEFAWAQWKGEEIQEGYLVTGIILPLVLPVSCPLWMLAIAVAFAVIFAKEIFGGTGMNIFNVALVARAFLFFSYPTVMSGETVWVARDTVFGLGNALPDTFTAATPLTATAHGIATNFTLADCALGFIPGSVGETSLIAIAIGAAILLITGVASWKTMVSVFAGGALTGAVLAALGQTDVQWYSQLAMGGFAFGAVFMATDPVTSARTEKGKYVFGLLVGIMAVIIRVENPGYPEGMMLAILLGNMFAPLIDWCVVEANINRRQSRLKK